LRDEAAALEAALALKGISRALDEEREGRLEAGRASPTPIGAAAAAAESGGLYGSVSIVSRHPHLKRTTPSPSDPVLEALASGGSTSSTSSTSHSQVQVGPERNTRQVGGEGAQQVGGGAVRIPSRVLPSGVVLPAYNEPPLRVAPPDHEFLTPKEAWEEDENRLRLYSAIASRVEEHLHALEKEVMARRKAKGWVEKRPMQV